MNTPASLLEAPRRQLLPRPEDESGTPVISYDLRLGQYFSLIDLNETMVADRLCDEGLSKEQAADTRVHISAASNKDKNNLIYGQYEKKHKSIKLFTSDTAYSSRKMTDELVSGFCDGASIEVTKFFEDIFNASGNERVADSYGGTLFHEIRHHSDYLLNREPVKANRNYILKHFAKVVLELGGLMTFNFGYPKFIAPITSIPDNIESVGTLLGVILYVVGKDIYNRKNNTDFKAYENAPLELSAQQAENDAPSNLFTVIRKDSMPLPKPDKKFFMKGRGIR